MPRYVRTVAHLEGWTPNARLGRLDIELTERCNNDCIHCSINRPEHDRVARALETGTAGLRGILSEAAEMGCLQVRFTGGEPLLRPDFEEIYVFARRLGLKTIVFTNARLITERLADLFADIPPLEPVEVSVYGLRARSYEAVTRVPGSFAQFRGGLDRLLDRMVPVVVKSAWLPPNKPEREEFEAFARGLPGAESAPRYTLAFEMRARRDDRAKNKLIATLRPAPAEILEILSRDAEEYRRGMEAFASRFMGPPGDRLFRCGAGGAPCVDAYGRIQPCIGLRAPELTAAAAEGAGGSLSAALDRFEALQEMTATNPDYLARCAVCALKGLCEQCPAKSWSESGTLDTPVEYLCAIAHAQARRLGWLGAEEQGWEAGARESLAALKKRLGSRVQ